MRITILAVQLMFLGLTYGQELTDDFNYIDFSKYYEKLISSSNENSQKQLNYCKALRKNYKKLEEKGYDLSILSTKWKKVTQLESDLNNVKNEKATSQTDIAYLNRIQINLSFYLQISPKNYSKIMFDQLKREVDINKLIVLSKNPTYSNHQSIQTYKQIEKISLEDKLSPLYGELKKQTNDQVYNMMLSAISNYINAYHYLLPNKSATVLKERTKLSNATNDQKDVLTANNKKPEKVIVPTSFENNPSLENEIRLLAKKKEPSTYKVIINSSKWVNEYEYNELVRKRRMVVGVSKSSEADCKLTYYSIIQKFYEGDLLPPQIDEVIQTRTVPCKEIN